MFAAQLSKSFFIILPVQTTLNGQLVELKQSGFIVYRFFNDKVLTTCLNNTIRIPPRNYGFNLKRLYCTKSLILNSIDLFEFVAHILSSSAQYPDQSSKRIDSFARFSFATGRISRHIERRGVVISQLLS